MSQATSDDAVVRIMKAADLYHRLVLVVGQPSSGKSRALQRLAKEFAVPVINLNLETSKYLLELTDRRRRLELPRILGDLVGEAGPIVLLDNTELLFDMSLQHDPLRLLQGLSRSRTVVASWRGNLQDGYLIYGAPEHPEYRRYPAGDIVVLRPGDVLR
jgi:hypothetical protein